MCACKSFIMVIWWAWRNLCLQLGVDHTDALLRRTWGQDPSTVYWPRSLLACLWTSTTSRTRLAFINRIYYMAYIMYRSRIFCGIQRTAPNLQFFRWWSHDRLKLGTMKLPRQKSVSSAGNIYINNINKINWLLEQPERGVARHASCGFWSAVQWVALGRSTRTILVPIAHFACLSRRGLGQGRAG